VGKTDRSGKKKESKNDGKGKANFGKMRNLID
jgi:hypothetical protein